MEYLIGFLLIILLPASILINIVLLIRGINIVKQNEQLVDTIMEYDNKEIVTQSNLESMLSKMKEIDIRGSFESDDEVGAVFSELKETIENYKTKSSNA
jgi:K+-transporting ATPase A subunit